VISTDCPGKVAPARAGNERSLPAAAQETVPVALANVCPALSRWMISRAMDPSGTAVRAGIRSFQARLDGKPTVTATPTVTVVTTTASAFDAPFPDLDRTGLAAGTTEIPARYCRGAAADRAPAAHELVPVPRRGVAAGQSRG